jgi:hypothetical protein
LPRITRHGPVFDSPSMERKHGDFAARFRQPTS